MKMIGFYIRTLRYLRVEQILALLAYRFRVLFYRSPLYSFLQEGKEVPKNLCMKPPLLWEGNKKNGQLIAEGSFIFVGRTINMSEGVRWLPKEASHLWQFHLHYHDWLADLHATNNKDIARNLIESWLLVCDHFHPVSWHPYPLSLRLVNWLTHAEWLLSGASDSLKEAFLESIVRQASHLERNVEWGLGGNHLIKNLKALLYVGVCVPNKQSLYLEAVNLLVEQLKIQILPDGGHYELSPLYHVQVMKDFLDVQALLRKAGQKIPPQLEDSLERMTNALAFFKYPDGKLPLFNDSAELDQTTLRSVFKKCGQSNEVPFILPESGYAQLAAGSVFVMFDAGRVCPDDLPGHAHADTLSFELSIKSERVFVNGGTYAYQNSLRSYFRGTSAHNTVCVDGENSAEVWGAFRVGRRPRRVTLSRFVNTTGDINVLGSHDGYKDVVHTRSLILLADGSQLQGEDILKGKKLQSHRIMAHFHVHPDISIHLVSESEARLKLGSGKMLSFKVAGGRLYEKESVYAPQFGLKYETRQLVVQGKWKDGQCHIKWQVHVLS